MKNGSHSKTFEMKNPGLSDFFFLEQILTVWLPRLFGSGSRLLRNLVSANWRWGEQEEKM